jgi:hypothetical protein
MMNKRKSAGILTLSLAFALIVPTQAQTPGTLNGGFTLYGGELGDWNSPPKVGAKINLLIEGTAASQMYSQLGPRAQTEGCAPSADKVRRQGDLRCVREPSGAAHCLIGVDLKSGKSINGSIC